jgi:hypothetical protein
MAAACSTLWPEPGSGSGPQAVVQVSADAAALVPPAAASDDPTPAISGLVSALDARRIEKALPRRARYKYVHPRVLREGLGWKIVSPNCSRSVDPQGGEIDIAWLVPAEQGGWLLHARDHRQASWVLKKHAPTLSTLLTHLCWDADREFWQ